MNLDSQKIKEIGYSLIDFQEENIDNFLKFIDHFPESGVTPKGMKKESSYLKTLKNCAEFYRTYKEISPNIRAVFTYLDEASISNIVDKFIKPDKIESLKLGRISFENKSRMSQERFINASKSVFELITSLKGFHAKAIEKPLKIIIQSASVQSTKATYKSELDEFWIKESAVDLTQSGYGSLPYIIAHELGHRFEKKVGTPPDFRDYESFTTPYSKSDSMAGSEAFAELFAISHFKSDYPQYSDKVEKFERQIQRAFMMDNDNSLSAG